MTSKAVKKPVHKVLLKETQLQALHRRRKLGSHKFALSNADPQPLPKEEVRSRKVVLPSSHGKSALPKKMQLRTRLKVLHSQVPSPSPSPPCSSCTTSACCRVFLVEITDEEFASGYYEDFATKFTEEQRTQLQSSLLTFSLAVRTAPSLLTPNTPAYLEGVPGVACPFLADDGGCSIYAYRPVTCRVYSCLDDPRITEEMRTSEDALAEYLEGTTAQ